MRYGFLFFFLFTLFSLSLAAQPFGETIVVTASLEPVEENLESSSNTVLTREDLEEQEVQTLGEALSLQTGMTVLQSGTPGKVTSLFTWGTESDHTLVLLNGIPLNSPYFSGFDFSSMPLDGFSRVEVVRGSASALYGPDAIGGVVQMFTDTIKSWQVRLAGGGDGYYHGALNIGQGPFYASFSTHRENGIMENDGLEQGQGILQYSGQNVGVFYMYGSQDVEIPFSGSAPSPRRSWEHETHTVAVPLQFQIGEHILWESRMGYAEGEQHFTDPDDPWGYTGSDTTTQRTILRSHLTARVRGWSLVGGLETRLDHVKDQSSYGMNLDNEEIKNSGIFVQARKQRRALSFRIGLRHDHHSTYGSSTHPRIGASYRWKKKHAVHVNFGTSFRAPSVGELYYPGSGNPDLNPEEGTSADVGYTYSGTSSTLDLRLFHNHLDEIIDFDYLSWTYQNAGESEISGMECRWAGSLRGAGELQLSATVLDHENTDTGERLLRRPEIHASVLYSLPLLQKGRITLAGHYVGERDDLDPVTYAVAKNESFTTADLIFHYPLGNTSPYVRVENLTDESYQEILGYPAPGRRFIVGIRIHGKGWNN